MFIVILVSVFRVIWLLNDCFRQEASSGLPHLRLINLDLPIDLVNLIVIRVVLSSKGVCLSMLFAHSVKATLVVWRLVSNNVSSRLGISSWQSIKSLSKSIARHDLFLRSRLRGIEIVKHEIQIRVSHLLKMVHDIFILVHLYSKMLFLVCGALCWKFIRCSNPGSMLLLLNLRSKVQDS